MSFVEFLQDDPQLTREQVMATLIQVANELGMPDKRGACVIAGMTVSQEAGVRDNDPPNLRRFWCPANHADEESFQYPHDSISDDGRSVGYFQQQKSASGALWWGPTSQEMNLHSAATEFMKRLKKAGYNASNAQAANDSAQHIQGSGFPNAYGQWWGDINGLYDSVISSGDVSVPDTKPPVVTPPTAAPFPEHNIIDGENASGRSSHRPRLFVLHTEEGNMLGQALDDWMDNNEVSYHYAVDPSGTAWDLVDTDLSSWSVLSANPDSINLVFAGSFAAWTRNDWLGKAGNAIKMAAFICARDCKKYGIPPVVRVGNSASGYPSLPTNDGVTDHYGITVGLHIGNHTDVGKGMPWDIFQDHLTKFYNGIEEDDFMSELSSDEQRRLLDRTDQIWGALFNRVESQSLYRDPEPGSPGNTWATKDLVRNMDGMTHEARVEQLARQGDDDALMRVLRVAAGEGAVTEEWATKRAAAVLAEIPEDVLKAYEDSNQ